MTKTQKERKTHESCHSSPSLRIIKLAEPRNPIKKYQSEKNERSKKAIQIIRDQPISTRIEHLAYPSVRYA